MRRNYQVKAIHNQKGVSIIAVVATMLILSVMGVTLISLVTTGSDVSINQLQSEQALNIAEGGKEYILANRTFPNYTLLAPGLTLGNGSFTVATSTNSTTVSADPGAAGTTINVASTAGFDIPGAIKIGSEYIYCSSTTATTFTGCARGYNVSTAAAHAIGSTVFQYIVTSTGTVGNSNRVIKVGVDGGGIAFDARSSSSGNNVSTLTWAHTVGAGSNRILVVGVSIRGTTSTVPFTGVTYAGTPLTLVGVQNSGTRCRVEIWRLVAPVTGANNIVVTFAGNTQFVAGAVSLTGVDQTTPIDAAFVGAFGNSTAPSRAITTVTNNAWVIDTLAARSAPTATIGAGQIQRWNLSIAGRIVGAGSTEGPKTPAGAVAMSWTLSVARDWALGAVAIRPAVTALTILTHEEVY